MRSRNKSGHWFRFVTTAARSEGSILRFCRWIPRLISLWFLFACLIAISPVRCTHWFLNIVYPHSTPSKSSFLFLFTELLLPAVADSNVCIHGQISSPLTPMLLRNALQWQFKASKRQDAIRVVACRTRIGSLFLWSCTCKYVSTLDASL